MIKDHLIDIDFRKRSERQRNHLEDFINWYKELANYSKQHDFNDRIQGQLTMLSSVLWYLMPEKDYKQLTRAK